MTAKTHTYILVQFSILGMPRWQPTSTIIGCGYTYMVLSINSHSANTTHCICMAGLGEACSHIAALLFAVETNTQLKSQFASTSLPCTWLPPSFRRFKESLKKGRCSIG